MKGDGYGMGVAAGDYDNDGHCDLFVTGYGENHLYHNTVTALSPMSRKSFLSVAVDGPPAPDGLITTAMDGSIYS